MSSVALRPFHWRIYYYAFWIFIAFVVALANFTLVAESGSDDNLRRYLTIHFFYWLAWGGIGEVVYRSCPSGLPIHSNRVLRSVGKQLLILVLTLFYFSLYFWIINPQQFEEHADFASILTHLYLTQGPLSFHLMNLITFGFVVIGAMLLKQVHFSREQQRQQAQLSLLRQTLETKLLQSKLDTLNNQIHPHFLFNAMNVIASLVDAGENDNAYEAITKLGTLLRHTFEMITCRKVYLWQEVQLVESMLEIGRIRFGSRLFWKIEVQASVEKAFIPPFILQPLVENALRHAVENSGEVVEINISASVRDGQLNLRVEDSGPGTELKEIQQGLGLGNLQERLSLAFKEKLIFETETSIGNGFSVHICIPFEQNHVE